MKKVPVFSTINMEYNMRKILRLIYRPYVYLVYMPLLALWTIVFGLMAIGIAMFSHRAAYWCGKIWGRLLCYCNFTRVRFSGWEHVDLNKPYVIMCNHQSLFDIPAFYGHWRGQMRWVMKQELRKVPVLGFACEKIRMVYIDRKNRESAIASLNKAKPMLMSGISIFIFPEGTRSDSATMLPFKKGGFIIAQDLGIPILPLSVNNTAGVLPNHTLNLFPGLIRFQIHPPIQTSDYSADERERLMQDVRLAIEKGLDVHYPGT